MITRGERRRRRRDPEWLALTEILGGGHDGQYIAGVLYGAGYGSPAKVSRISDEEVDVLLIGRRGKERVRVLRAELNRGETWKADE